MAERGTVKKERTYKDELREMVGDRDPKEFKAATHAQSELQTFSEWTQTVTPEAIVRGSRPPEFPRMARHLSVLRPWLERLATLFITPPPASLHTKRTSSGGWTLN
jgi:hypothetical protein